MPHTDQQQFFKQLQAHLNYPSGKRLAIEIAALLGRSQSSIYGRMSGKTVLTMSEYIAIRDHYRFIYHPDGKAREFAMTSVRELGSMARELQATLEAGDRLYFGSTEIPVFYLFHFPLLAALKLHYWLHRSAEDPEAPLDPFDYREADFERSDRYQQMRALATCYERIPREEIWMPGMLDNLCAQLVGLREQGLIEPPLAARVVEQLYALTDYLNKSFYQSAYANRTVWYNEQSNTNGRVLREGEGRRIVYLTGTDLLIYKHTNPMLYQDFLHIWERQRLFAVPLTHGSARDRRAFFSGVRARIGLLAGE